MRGLGTTVRDPNNRPGNRHARARSRAPALMPSVKSTAKSATSARLRTSGSSGVTGQEVENSLAHGEPRGQEQYGSREHASIGVVGKQDRHDEHDREDQRQRHVWRLDGSINDVGSFFSPRARSRAHHMLSSVPPGERTEPNKRGRPLDWMHQVHPAKSGSIP